MTRKLKIAHLFQSSHIDFSDPQAAQIHIFHTISSLQARGHQVSLLALDGLRTLYTTDLGIFQSAGVKERYYGRSGWVNKQPFLWFERVIRRVQREVRFPYLALFDSYRLYDGCKHNLKNTHVIHERFNLLALGGALASRRLGIPLVLEVNADLLVQRRFKGKPEKGLRLKFAQWATRYCFDTATKIICISGQLKDHLHKRWGVPNEKLAVLPCAADVAAFDGDFDSTKIKVELGLTDEPVVVWIGGFYEWHDLSLLIDSFASVLHDVPKARLLLIGDGPNRLMVEKMIEESDLSQAVILTGSVPHRKIPELLSVADVAVVPSVSVGAGEGGTGTPLKLFEYMAAGKPIVATDLPTAREVIQDGQTGCLVEPENVNAFSASLLRLLVDNAERSRLGQNARRQATLQHTWEIYAENLEGIYECVLNSA